LRSALAEFFLHLAHGVKQAAGARCFFVQRRVGRHERPAAEQFSVNCCVVELRHAHGLGDGGERARVHLGIFTQIEVVAAEAQDLDLTDQRIEQAALRVLGPSADQCLAYDV
jgi:hypothetical protein